MAESGEAEGVPPVTRREDARGFRWGSDTLAMSGLERMRAAVDGSLPDSPVMRLTGFRITEAGPGTATVAMPASPWWQSSIGMFTPGTLAIVADAALGGAVMTTLPPGVALTTSQLAMSFLRTPSVESGAITARGRLVHETHTLGLCEALVEDADGRLLAHATTRCVLLRVESHGRGSSTRSIGSAATSGPDPYERPVETTVEGRAVWNRSPGIERLRDLKRRVHPTPLMQLTGIRVAEVMQGEVTVGMEASDWLANYGGTLYGGATTLLAEGACTAAVLSTLPAGTACAPLDISVNFLRAIRPFNGEVMARAKVTHKGRTFATVSCEVMAEGKIAAISNESVLLLPGRRWDEPLDVANEVVPASDD
jgi:uncharacterized protein (TIGR00369 family)